MAELIGLRRHCVITMFLVIIFVLLVFTSVSHPELRWQNGWLYKIKKINVPSKYFGPQALSDPSSKIQGL